MWNSSALVRQERSEKEFYRQQNEMYDLLSERIPAEVNEWLLDICYEVALHRDVDNPSEHIDTAKEILFRFVNNQDFLVDNS